MAIHRLSGRDRVIPRGNSNAFIDRRPSWFPKVLSFDKYVGWDPEGTPPSGCHDAVGPLRGPTLRLALAQQIAGLAPLTWRATKTALHRLREAEGLPEDEDLIRLCYESSDFREGLEAFLGKRPAVWSGR